MLKKFDQFLHKPENSWLISAVTILLVVVFLWLPFGLKTSDTQVGWNMLRLVKQDRWILQSGRFMAPLPWWVAGVITPDSFVGLQLLAILFFWAKAFTVYLILCFLRVIDHAHALFIGILFMIYPADSGLFRMAALGYHSSVLFFLLSVLLLVLSCRYSSKLYLLLMVIAHAVSSFTVEAGSILAFFTPLLIILVPECGKKRKTTILILWYLILILSLMNYSYYWINGDGYQNMRFERGFSGNIITFLMDVILGNVKAMWFAFIVSWWNVIESLLTSWRYLPYAIIITLVSAGGVWWLNRVSRDEDNIFFANSKLVFVLLAGIVIFFLGFLPFSVTDIRDGTFRVFYYSALGTAIFWGTIVYFVNRSLRKRKSNIFPLLNVMLILGIAVHALDQHASFYSASLEQQHILVSVMEQAPYLKTGTVIVLIEKSVADRVFSHEHIISSALGWAYSKEGISGLICYQNSGNCRFVENGLDYRSIRPDFADMNKIYPYEDILVFQKMEDGSADFLYDIKSLYSSTSEYNPYDRIASYLPFPKLPQKAFYASVGPNPLHLSPKDWDGVNLTLNDRKVCDVSEDQQCSLHLQGDASGLASFRQEIKVGGKAGQIVMLSLLIKAERISDNASWPQTALTFINTDGTTTQYSQTLEKLTEDWYNFIWEVQAAKPFQAILVSVESGSGSWSVWVDTLQLDVDNTPVNILNPSFED